MPNRKLTSRQKKALEDKAVKTDLYSIATGIVDQRMSAYVVYNAEEHHQTRISFKRLEKVIKEKESSRIHNIIQDVVIVGLIIIMIICSGSNPLY